MQQVPRFCRSSTRRAVLFASSEQKDGQFLLLCDYYAHLILFLCTTRTLHKQYCQIFTMSAYNDATSSDMNGIRQAGPAQDSKVALYASCHCVLSNPARNSSRSSTTRSYLRPVFSRAEASDITSSLRPFLTGMTISELQRATRASRCLTSYTQNPRHKLIRLPSDISSDHVRLDVSLLIYSFLPKSV